MIQMEICVISQKNHQIHKEKYMKKIESERALKELFDCRNHEKPFVLIIGKNGCPNCKMLVSAIEATPASDFPDNVDLYDYIMQDEDFNDGSFIMKDLDEITGSPVMTLPYVVYVEAGMNNIKTGGMLPISIFTDKVKKLSESKIDESAEEPSDDTDCASCHV